MERGAATRGKVAGAVAGADAIEIKATIPDHQIGDALARFGLTEANDEERFIYFFDTPGLELLRAGIIARARRVVGEGHDSTVKLRPVEPADVDRKWHRYRDFKIEADASEAKLVKSASFSMPVVKGLIKRVAAGTKPIEAIFTEAQEEFLMTMAGHAIDFAHLVVLGPLTAQRWQFEDPACPWPITAELWKRDDGARLMEVSIKAPIVQAAVAVGGFMAFLAEVGAERDGNQQTKTRWALEHCVAGLRRTPARETAAGKATARRPKRGQSGRPPAAAAVRRVSEVSGDLEGERPANPASVRAAGLRVW
jgi:hypothetical protein